MKDKKKKVVEVAEEQEVSKHLAMLRQHAENKYYRRKEHNDGIHKIKHPPNTLK